MPENQDRKKGVIQKLLLSFIVTLIFLGILSSIYYYFVVYKSKDNFPKVISTVNKEDLKNNGFQEVKILNNKVSYFVPEYWVVVNESQNVYGDTLNGSYAYINTNENSLGVLTDSVCDQISSQYINTVDVTLFSELIKKSSEIKTKGDFTGCLTEFSAKMSPSSKEFGITLFYIFRKDLIYTIDITSAANLESESINTETILKSITIQED
jgi:hypothetical protein